MDSTSESDSNEDTDELKSREKSCSEELNGNWNNYQIIQEDSDSESIFSLTRRRCICDLKEEIGVLNDYEISDLSFCKCCTKKGSLTSQRSSELSSPEISPEVNSPINSTSPPDENSPVSSTPSSEGKSPTASTESTTDSNGSTSTTSTEETESFFNISTMGPAVHYSLSRLINAEKAALTQELTELEEVRNNWKIGFETGVNQKVEETQKEDRKVGKIASTKSSRTNSLRKTASNFSSPKSRPVFPKVSH